ncbi:HET-domain-containing protein [Hypoxylon sp. FL1150]|nr:HET-domain-containing protein [Hypoxylon sp. FL1150]
MRLINVDSLLLVEFFGDDIPPYAILSHTWGQGEVSYQEWQNTQSATRKAGHSKIESACLKAKSHGLAWLWVDTNCIDKTSSAELTEAINSMFQWYAESEECYAYLSDVATAKDIHWKELMLSFRRSRWFTRGWTLQELLAPKKLTFHAADWSPIGNREQSQVAREISSVTSIDMATLTGADSARAASIVRKMSWLSNRVTTRTEDLAYCMLGLFDINMPLLYGEGKKAFVRLQEEIIKVSNDHTIFCWSWTTSVPGVWASLLAPSPDTYRHSGNFVRNDIVNRVEHRAFKGVSTYTMTNGGLSIRLPVIRTLSPSQYMLALHVAVGATSDMEMPCIPVFGERRDGVLYLARMSLPSRPVIVNHDSLTALAQESLLIRARLESLEPRLYIWDSWIMQHKRSICGVLPLLDSTVSPGERNPEYIIQLFPERCGSTRLAYNLTYLGYQDLKGSVRRSAVTQVLLAARPGEGSTRWFCQVFVKDDDGNGMVDSGSLRDIEPQVLEAQFKQAAHYNKHVGISAVFGKEIHPFGCFRHIRVLYISKGNIEFKHKTWLEMKGGRTSRGSRRSRKRCKLYRREDALYVGNAKRFHKWKIQTKRLFMNHTFMSRYLSRYRPTNLNGTQSATPQPLTRVYSR